MIERFAPESEASQMSTRNSDLPHILLAIDQLGKTLGGGERIVLKLATQLPKYGYRVSIMTFSLDRESAALKLATCPIYLLPLRCTYDVQAFRAAARLKQFLRDEKVQIVQTFFESSDLWAGFVARYRAKVKVIWSRRDMGILRTAKHRAAYRILAGMPDMVFAVSDRVRQHSIEIDRVTPARVQTIYNGLDLDNWKMSTDTAKSAGELTITTVGNIRRVKGHDVLIKAAAIVVQQFPQAVFSIAGEMLEPIYFEELKTLVNNLNLSNHVRFEGAIADPRPHLAAADIFVLPSRSEGFSNAIIEAMAASLPVIATDVGGNAEAVSDGISGIIVAPGDPNLLATAILRLITNPDQARAMGAAGRKRSKEEFTTEAMMSRTVSTYRKLLSQE